MKTIISILLSCWVFSQSVGFEPNDIIQFELLLEHIEYHSQNHGDDFYTFFEKHYGALKTEHQKAHQDERAQHEKLPFQHYNFNHSLSEVVVFGYVFSLGKPFSFFTAEHHSHYQELYSFLERVSIFQPPKMA